MVMLNVTFSLGHLKINFLTHPVVKLALYSRRDGKIELHSFFIPTVVAIAFDSGTNNEWRWKRE